MKDNKHICLVDNTIHSTLPDLHLYLRKIKWKQAKYYETFFQRKDKLTGEVIPFKDLKTYFKVDFLNKENLQKWAKKNPNEAIEWTRNYIKARKNDKKLIFAPSHFELSTLFCPSVDFIEEYSDYNKLCESIGLKPKFDYKKKLVFNPLPENFKVICDTREQMPLKFVKSETKKLNYGDYTLSHGNSNIFIERKALGDAISTLSGGYERFYREVERAKKDNAYLFVGIEVDFETFKNFDNDYRMRFAKVSPEHIFKNMRDLLLDFDNIQFIFADSRVRLTDLMIKIYKLGEQAKTTDLQYSITKGLI